MGKYLFRFGYCTPAQWSANEAHGWDDESSAALFVEADSPELAQRWGEHVAEQFVAGLFLAAGSTRDPPSWKASEFASWIEDEPEKDSSSGELARIPVVKCGELPDFRAFLPK